MQIQKANTLTGSIPACAGEPRRRCPDGTRARVYPRLCGGTGMSSTSHLSASGLSPRVRGNRYARPARIPDAGSIPACAGEPSFRRAAAYADWVYPRVCGGTRVRFVGQSPGAGLSPRVRGNRWGDDYAYAGLRSIPACAGEPRGRRILYGFVGVYPRVCGGTGSVAGGRLLADGLSPRVRGNRRNLPAPKPLSGSIPACAGEPTGIALPASRQRVYPRVCGGTGLTQDIHKGGHGLSPRVRGNLCPRWKGGWIARSIPACAGEPVCWALLGETETVYPRVCGGTPTRIPACTTT